MSLPVTGSVTSGLTGSGLGYGVGLHKDWGLVTTKKLVWDGITRTVKKLSEEEEAILPGSKQPVHHYIGCKNFVSHEFRQRKMNIF